MSLTESPTTAGETFTVTLSDGAGALSATTGRQRRRRDDHAFEWRQDADNRRLSFAGQRGSNDACRNGCDDGVRCHFRQRFGQQWWIGWARYDRGDGQRGAVDQRAGERDGGAERGDGDLGRQRFGDRQHDDQRRNLHSRGVGQLGRSVGEYQRDGRRRDDHALQRQQDVDHRRDAVPGRRRPHDAEGRREFDERGYADRLGDGQLRQQRDEVASGDGDPGDRSCCR